METKNHCCDCSSSEEGVCGSMSCHGKSFYYVRWIFGLIIVVMVFCLGVQVGELRSLVGYKSFNHGGYMMGGRANYMMTLPTGDVYGGNLYQ